MDDCEKTFKNIDLVPSFSDPNRIPDELLKLIEESDSLERQISEAGIILQENNIGMKEPLVDSADFPRNDVQVYEVRLARAKINRLQTDYKVLRAKIEEAMSSYHHKFGNESVDKTIRPPTLKAKCFRHLAKIGTISEDSPAMLANLKEGDIIVEIGSVNGDNFKSLQDIAFVVMSNQNSYIKVVVQRDGNLLRVNLKPRIWSGSGLLGCNILPAD